MIDSESLLQRRRRERLHPVWLALVLSLKDLHRVCFFDEVNGVIAEIAVGWVLLEKLLELELWLAGRITKGSRKEI